MITLFRGGRGILLPIAVLGLTAGIVLARRADQRAPLRPLSVSGVRARAKPSVPSYRAKLSLSEARPERDGEMVQRLSDGTRVTYTIDSELQKRAQRLLRSYQVPQAGIVMYDVRTGDVLVMAGSSAEAPGKSPEELCLRPWAPAASVFKLVTAGALLERGVPPDVGVCYHGGLRGLYPHHLVNNPARDGRCNTLSAGIARSINPIMAKLAVRYLDRDVLTRWAGRFGFDRAVPFDLPVAPSRTAIPKDKLEFARAAAGFRHTDLTVLHGAMIAATIANGGALPMPRIIRSVRSARGKELAREQRAPARRVLKAATARALARMMTATAETGTARRAFRPRRGRPALPEGVRVAGKTGSLSRQRPFLHYNWFVGFAPVKRPEVAFAVLLGNPARWRIKATTATRLLLHDYLQLTRKRQKQQQLVSRRKKANTI